MRGRKHDKGKHGGRTAKAGSQIRSTDDASPGFERRYCRGVLSCGHHDPACLQSNRTEDACTRIRAPNYTQC